VSNATHIEVSIIGAEVKMKKRPITHVSLLLLFSYIPSAVAQVVDPYNITGFDFAPDYSKDKFPPYPPLAGPDGRIVIENLRGTRLYGWKGCEAKETNLITEAWDDFHKLADQLEVSNNIGFNEQSAREFWGASSGRNALSQDTKKQILRKSQPGLKAGWPNGVSQRSLPKHSRCMRFHGHGILLGSPFTRDLYGLRYSIS
jgi:hypothetical protein